MCRELDFIEVVTTSATAADTRRFCLTPPSRAVFTNKELPN